MTQLPFKLFTDMVTKLFSRLHKDVEIDLYYFGHILFKNQSERSILIRCTLQRDTHFLRIDMEAREQHQTMEYMSKVKPNSTEFCKK